MIRDEELKWAPEMTEVDGVGCTHQGVYPNAIRYCILFQSICDQFSTSPRL